ncbi:MAG TPA: asparagine synthase (glutamine-hydrolyzing) [Gemmatimonadaceae bacterium]|nr:asparagine synthase (glutamine-hydrolyzing) [Gemmatimonadaceae bacterium]
MCGIAGLACATHDCHEDHEAIVAAMCEMQAHRGPDDQGVVLLDRVCLGSRRLSILDVSPAGHMPMCDPTGRWWVTYNGEVYNYRALREELQALGHAFTSDGDTEVILHAWMEWGRDAFARFVGMFAIALVDRDTGTLQLVRDRYGIKPLYHAAVNGHLLFSSEMKTLGPCTQPARVDRQRLMEWFLYRNADSFRPETMIEGISSVLPGHVVTVRNGEVRSAPFYNLLSHVRAEAHEGYRRARETDVVARVDSALREAVQCRLVSDVPVGTLCSGGLDSSLVTAIAGEYTRDITAFNVAIENAPELDERRFAEQLTRSLGIELVSFTLTGDAFRAMLPRAVYHSDLPLTHPNSVAYLHISQVARSHGVVVLLSGEGADELFGGYSWSYRRLRTVERLLPLLGHLPHRLIDQVTLVAYAMAGLPATAHRFRETLPPTVGAIDGYARRGWARECEQAYEFVPRAIDRTVLGRMLGDLHDFLPPLLRRLDRMTMAASVESRVPFLDHRLVHEVVNLPLHYRVSARADKWLLKRVAERYLPRRNIWRKKMGFPIPLASYIAPYADFRFFRNGFCQQLMPLGETGLRDAIARWASNPFAFFGLLTLEMWGRMFVMGQTLDAVEQCFATSGSAASYAGHDEMPAGQPR